jgi:hypothetical protein
MLMRVLVALTFSVLALTMPLNQRGSAYSDAILAKGLTDLTDTIAGFTDDTSVDVLGHNINVGGSGDP